MNRIVFLSLIILIPILGFTQNEPTKTVGGPLNDIGYTLCLTNDGGFLLVGTTRADSSRSEDIYMIMFNNQGDELWKKTYGWKHHDLIRSVLPLDNGYLMVGEVWEYGMARLDIYLLKTDLFGNQVWDQQYGTNYRDIGFEVVPSIDNGFLILGHSRGNKNAGDIFLLKTNDAGEEIWRKTYGSIYDDYGHGLFQLENGTIYIFGSKGAFYNDVHANFKNHDADMYLIKADENGNEIWEKTYGKSEHDLGYSMTKASDGGLYLFGSSQSYGNGSFDMLLIRINDQGEVVWQKTYGGTNYEQGLSMVKNEQDELFLFGTTKSFGENNSPDLFLIKTDDEGNEIWNLTIGGDNIEIGYKVVATPDSGCAVIGQTNSSGNGKYDMAFVKVDNNGLIEYFTNSEDTALKGEFVVYPVPLRNLGRIKFKNDHTVNVYHMEIISMSGVHARSFTIYPPDYSFNNISLPAGLYVYRIISEDNSTVLYKGKLVIQ